MADPPAKLSPGCDEPHESDLQARFREGDRIAFDVLWNRHSPAVEQALHRKFGALVCDDIPDLTQQTGAKAWKNRSTFDTSQSFVNWIVVIAAHTAEDFIRERARRKTGGDGLTAIDEPIQPDETKSERRDSESEQRLTIVQKTLDSLSKRPRDVYLAKMRDGQPFRTIARRSKLTESTIRSNFSRAKKAIDQALESAGCATTVGKGELAEIGRRLAQTPLGSASGLSPTEAVQAVRKPARQIERPVRSGGRAYGPPEFLSTGFPALDALLGGDGLVRGWAAIIRGDAGSGKTTLALQIARHAVIEHDHVFAFASVEDDPDVLLNQVTRSYWNCDYTSYIGRADHCKVEDFNRHVDETLVKEAKEATREEWLRQASLTPKQRKSITAEALDKFFELYKVKAKEAAEVRRLLGEMDAAPVLAEFWRKLDVNPERPIILVVDSLNALIHASAARFRNVSERQIMQAVLHSFRDWRSRRRGKVTVLFLVEDGSGLDDAAASYAADIVIDLQRSTTEHEIFGTTEQSRLWRQEMRFCKVSKGRGLATQTRSCFYEFLRDEKGEHDKGGVVFLPTYAAAGLVSLFQENKPMQDVINSLREHDVPALYPQVVVQEFTRTALQRVFSVSRRRTDISPRHPLMLSNVDEYWLKLLREKKLLQPIPAKMLRAFSLSLEKPVDGAGATMFLHEFGGPSQNIFSEQTPDGTIYYGVPQVANVGMMVYRKDLFDKLGIRPPDTWEELEEIFKRMRGDPATADNKLLLELTSYDTFLATALELGWSHGAFWRTRLVDGQLRLKFDDDERGLLYLLAALERLRYWIHVLQIVPKHCSVDPKQFKPGNKWIVARHWYSTWINVRSQESAYRNEFGVLPIPVSEEYRRRAGADVKHRSAWGVWYLAVLRGSENIELGADLINNLMTARKISERARSGAALPTVEKFYEITDENCPETDVSFNEFRSRFFTDAMSRCDFAEYPRFARSFSALLQTLATNAQADLVDALRKAFANIDPTFRLPHDLGKRWEEFRRAEFPQFLDDPAGR